VFDMPFAFPNIGVASRVIDLDSSFGQKLAERHRGQDRLKVLGLIDSGGFFAITNSQRPITSVEDMKGLRIRTMTLPTHEAIVSSLGGQPTALPWAEVYTALQTGVADGQMNPIPIIAFAKFDEVQKYLSITNHIITPYIWTMNADFYERPQRRAPHARRLGGRGGDRGRPVDVAHHRGLRARPAASWPRRWRSTWSPRGAEALRRGRAAGGAQADRGAATAPRGSRCSTRCSPRSRRRWSARSETRLRSETGPRGARGHPFREVPAVRPTRSPAAAGPDAVFAVRQPDGRRDAPWTAAQDAILNDGPSPRPGGSSPPGPAMRRHRWSRCRAWPPRLGVAALHYKDEARASAWAASRRWAAPMPWRG
jgi:hypothetical protein